MEFNQFKIEVYIPKTHVLEVRNALNELGVLKIGDYDMCIAETNVLGYFRPLENANPYEGKIGEITSVPEVKLEFSCFKKDIANVVKIIKKYHPYEEPVYRIIPVLTYL